MASKKAAMLPTTKRYLLGALNYAVGAGELDMIRRVVSTGINVQDKLDENSYDILYIAVVGNRVEIVGAILMASDWHLEGQMGLEYLQVALTHKNVEMVELLLRHRAGAAVGVPFAFRREVMSEPEQHQFLDMIASSSTNVRLHESIIGSASYGNLSVFDRLLHWDPLTTRIFTAGTISKAIDGAAFFGRDDVIARILAADEMAPLLNAQRLSDALGCLCADSMSPRPQRYAAILKLLVDRGASSRQLNKYQISCAFETKENMLKSRLAFGHEMKSCKAVDALLHFAALGDNVMAIRLLVKTFKWDVNLTAFVPYVNVLNHSKSVAKKTALAIAARHNSLEAARCLLELGAKIDLRTDRDKLTPLHHACLNHNYEMIDLLLKSGADVKLTCEGGLTALHLLVWREGDRPEYVEKLLKLGVKLKGVATSPLSKKAFSEVSQHGVVEDLYKAKFSVVTRCCRGGGLESLKVLLSYGADVNSYSALLDEPPLTSACRVDDCSVWPHCCYHNLARQKALIDLILPGLDADHRLFQTQHAVDYCVGRNFELLIHILRRCDRDILAQIIVGDQSFLQTYGPLGVDCPGSLSTYQLIEVLRTIIRRLDRHRWSEDIVPCLRNPANLEGFWFDHTPFITCALLGECSGLPNDMASYLAVRAAVVQDPYLANVARHFRRSGENFPDDCVRGLNAPFSLKHIARVYIRERIAERTCDVNTGVRELKSVPLPTSLIEFLTFQVKTLV